MAACRTVLLTLLCGCPLWAAQTGPMSITAQNLDPMTVNRSSTTPLRGAFAGPTDPKLVASDPDAPALDGPTWRVTAIPIGGAIVANRTTVPVFLSLGDTFTQRELDTLTIGYHHGGQVANDSFALRAEDGQGEVSLSQAVLIRALLNGPQLTWDDTPNVFDNRNGVTSAPLRLYPNATLAPSAGNGTDRITSLTVTHDLGALGDGLGIDDDAALPESEQRLRVRAIPGSTRLEVVVRSSAQSTYVRIATFDPAVTTSASSLPLPLRLLIEPLSVTDSVHFDLMSRLIQRIAFTRFDNLRRSASERRFALTLNVIANSSIALPPQTIANRTITVLSTNQVPTFTNLGTTHVTRDGIPIEDVVRVRDEDSSLVTIEVQTPPSQGTWTWLGDVAAIGAGDFQRRYRYLPAAATTSAPLRQDVAGLLVRDDNADGSGGAGEQRFDIHAATSDATTARIASDMRLALRAGQVLNATLTVVPPAGDGVNDLQSTLRVVPDTLYLNDGRTISISISSATPPVLSAVTPFGLSEAELLRFSVVATVTRASAPGTIVGIDVQPAAVLVLANQNASAVPPAAPQVAQ